MLSNKVITHKVIVKNADWKWITKYPLTKDMYVTYRLAKQDRKIWDTLWLTDIDWNRIRELDPIKFEEFEEVKITNNDNRCWVCSYGGRHPISQAWECDCQEIFGILPHKFKEWLIEKWYKIEDNKWKKRDIFYDSDITDFHRKEFLNKSQ